MRSLVKGAISLLLFLMLHPGWLAALSDDSVQLAVYDGDVYLYLLDSPRGQFAYNFYRKLPDESGFTKINASPVQSIASGEQLRGVLGNQYDRIRRSADVSSDAALLAMAQRNSREANILSLAYPQLAQAVNKLYVDEDVPEGERVEYRVEVLNQREEPTGEMLENAIQVENPEYGVTEITDVYNEGNRVTVEWTYTPVDDIDNVFRFDVYAGISGSERVNRVNNGIVLRDLSRDTLRYSFSTQNVGDEMVIRVGSVNITAEQGPLSEPVTLVVEDNVAPSVVQNLSTSLRQDSVQVQWRVSRELDTEGYNIYRGTESDGEFEKLNSELIPVEQPYYFDREVLQGQRYLYKVTAVDDSGNESEKSTAVPRIIPDQTPPPAVSELAANLNSNQNGIDLTWSMQEFPDDFRNFIILRRVVEGRSPSANYSQLPDSEIRETSFRDEGREDSGFEEGALYRYGIVAADSSRNFSDTTFVDIRIPNVTPPNAPNVVRAQNRDGVRVNVNWSGSLSRDVGTYHLYRKQGAGDFELTGELDAGERQFRDERVDIGETYIYAVSAVDTSGNESELVETQSVLVKRNYPPRQVRNVRAVQTSEGVRIHWEPVASEHLAGYRVYVANRSTGNFEPVQEELLSETNLTTNVDSESVWFRVTALDVTGNESRPSEPVKLMVP